MGDKKEEKPDPKLPSSGDMKTSLGEALREAVEKKERKEQKKDEK